MYGRQHVYGTNVLTSTTILPCVSGGVRSNYCGVTVLCVLVLATHYHMNDDSGCVSASSLYIDRKGGGGQRQNLWYFSAFLSLFPSPIVSLPACSRFRHHKP